MNPKSNIDMWQALLLYLDEKLPCCWRWADRRRPGILICVSCPDTKFLTKVIMPGLAKTLNPYLKPEPDHYLMFQPRIIDQDGMTHELEAVWVLSYTVTLDTSSTTGRPYRIYTGGSTTWTTTGW